MDENRKPDKIQAFDALYTNNHIQICKLLLPYFEPAVQRQLAVLIKYMELEYTLSCLRIHPCYCQKREAFSDSDAVCHEILPFCSPAEKKQLQKIMELTGTMKNAQEMMETFSMMKELFPDGFSPGDGSEGSPDLMQLLQIFEAAAGSQT